MTRSKLQIIADHMIAAIAAKPFGWTNNSLPGGLDIVMSRNGDKWRLAIRREKVFPSDTEADIIFHAFAVPVGSEPIRRQFCEAHPTTQRRIEWRIIEWNWIEADEEPASQLPSATTA